MKTTICLGLLETVDKDQSKILSQDGGCYLEAFNLVRKTIYCRVLTTGSGKACKEFFPSVCSGAGVSLSIRAFFVHSKNMDTSQQKTHDGYTGSCDPGDVVLMSLIRRQYKSPCTRQLQNLTRREGRYSLHWRSGKNG